MKRLLLSLLVLPLPSFAQSSLFEIGATGGIHAQTSPRTPIPYFANGIGSLYFRYGFAPKWKAGIGLSILGGKYVARKELSPTTDATYYIGSPILNVGATLTRVVHAAKWQTALTLKVGFVKTFEKEVPLVNGGFDQTEFAYPAGTGATAGIHIEQSKMFTKNIGLIGTVGLDYYRLSWSANASTSNVPFRGDATGSFLSLPAQIGIILKP